MDYVIKILEMGTALLSPFVTMLFFFALLGVPIALIIILANLSHKDIFSRKNKKDSDSKQTRKNCLVNLQRVLSNDFYDQLNDIGLKEDAVKYRSKANT